jgi:DNA-binding winged helix-turn-helix (wHTH) protein
MKRAVAPTPVCPCCGAPVDPSRLMVDLSTNRATRNGATVNLTPRMVELLAVLNEAYPNAATHERLMLRMFGADGGPDCTDTLKVHVSKLRKYLAPLGLAIEPLWGQGYQLVIAGQAREPTHRGTNQRWGREELKTLEHMVFVAKIDPVQAAIKLGRSPYGTIHQVRKIATRRGKEAGAHNADAA